VVKQLQAISRVEMEDEHEEMESITNIQEHSNHLHITLRSPERAGALLTRFRQAPLQSVLHMLVVITISLALLAFLPRPFLRTGWDKMKQLGEFESRW